MLFNFTHGYGTMCTYFSVSTVYNYCKLLLSWLDLRRSSKLRRRRRSEKKEIEQK
jgi:hypothetical protein